MLRTSSAFESLISFGINSEEKGSYVGNALIATIEGK